MPADEHSAEFKAFDSLVRHALSVPREEILRREEEYKKKAALNLHKRGPKPKPKNGADHGPAEQLPS